MNRKAISLRIPKELWVFSKKKAVDREMSFNDIVVELLTKYKLKCEKKLTSEDTTV